MDVRKALNSLAQERDVQLTRLLDVNTRYSHSAKVACCGGLMTRVVTETAADSTVLLYDGSSSCYCALHGDITSRYPDVLTTGALLLFTDITVLVVSSKVPPMLIACLQNLAGLLLPEDSSGAATAVTSAEKAAPNLIPETYEAQNKSFEGGTAGSNDLIASFQNQQSGLVRECAASGSDMFYDGRAALDLRPSPRCMGTAVATPVGSTTRDHEADVPLHKRTRAESPAPPPVMDNEDDADCLELADDL